MPFLFLVCVSTHSDIKPVRNAAPYRGTHRNTWQAGHVRPVATLAEAKRLLKSRPGAWEIEEHPTPQNISYACRTLGQAWARANDLRLRGWKVVSKASTPETYVAHMRTPSGESAIRVTWQKEI